MTSYTKFFMVAAALACAASLACADEVVVKGLTYANAKITGIAEGEMTWELDTGSSVSKPLDAVSRVSVTGQDTFNDAEDKLAKGKAADAVKAYDQAGDMAAGIDWLKQLITVRRLKALNQAGMTDRGVKEWVDLLEQSSSAKYALNLRPSKIAKGAKGNDAAIKLLEEKVVGKDGEAAASMRKLLMDLYAAQGQNAKASAVAGAIAKKTAKTADSSNSADDAKESSSSSGSLGDQLSAAEVQIKGGGAKQALSSLQASLKQYTPGDLPKALLLIGKAQMALAKAAADAEKPQLQMEAGLNFMRVVAFYPTTNEAAEAIYLAGTVNVELGNRAGARAAFNKVLSDYKESSYAAKATAAIEEMEKAAAAPAAPKGAKKAVAEPKKDAQ